MSLWYILKGVVTSIPLIKIEVITILQLQQYQSEIILTISQSKVAKNYKIEDKNKNP